jgi:pimeloyl-ACP methyl ester carboxylesterase
VLAGHSFGGLYTLTFAARYPDEVAGMVLVDSTAPASVVKPSATPPSDGGSYDLMGRVSALLSSSVRLGLGHLIGVPTRKPPPQHDRRVRPDELLHGGSGISA